MGDAVRLHEDTRGSAHPMKTGLGSMVVLCACRDSRPSRTVSPQVSGKGPVSQSLRNEFDTLLTFVDVANDECDFGHGLEVFP